MILPRDVLGEVVGFLDVVYDKFPRGWEKQWEKATRFTWLTAMDKVESGYQVSFLINDCLHSRNGHPAFCVTHVRDSKIVHVENGWCRQSGSHRANDQPAEETFRIEGHIIFRTLSWFWKGEPYRRNHLPVSVEWRCDTSKISPPLVPPPDLWDKDGANIRKWWDALDLRAFGHSMTRIEHNWFGNNGASKTELIRLVDADMSLSFWKKQYELATIYAHPSKPLSIKRKRKRNSS